MPHRLLLASAAATCFLLTGISSFPLRAAQAQTGEQTWLARSPSLASTATKRVALVVGNTHYGSGKALPNPETDARSMARCLQALGFDVYMCLDQNNRQMADDLSEFGTRSAGAGVALFYYSGHGSQIGGENYLIPVGFDGHEPADVKYGTLNLSRLIDTLTEAKSHVNIVILDACRDNPFVNEVRTHAPGFAALPAPVNTLLAYATGPGSAPHGNPGDPNGLFTQELLRQIKTPGVQVEDIFMNARKAVVTVSRGAQVPWEESSLEEELYFAGAALPIVSSVPKFVSQPAPPPIPTLVSRPALRPVPTFASQTASPPIPKDMGKIATSPVNIPQGNVIVPKATVDIPTVGGGITTTPVIVPKTTMSVPPIATTVPTAAATVDFSAAAGEFASLTDADAAFDRGVALFTAGDKSRAGAAFSRAIALRSSFALASYNRGLCLADARDHKSAIDDFTKTIERRPTMYDAFVARGRSYLALGDMPHAFEDLTRAEAIKPDRPDAYRTLGDACFDAGQYDNAVAQYARGLAAQTKPNASLFFNCGLANYNLKNYEAAAANFKQAAALASDSTPRAAVLLGDSYMQLHRYADAIPAYAAYLAAHTDETGSALHNRAIAEYSVKQYAQAARDLTAYLKLHPDDDDAATYLATAQRKASGKEK